MEKRGFTEQEARNKLGMPVRLRASNLDIDPGTLGYVISADQIADDYSVLVEWHTRGSKEGARPQQWFTRELYETLFVEV
jgi:hypothetical protein